MSLTSSFQRIILPECWYRITLDRTQKANLMSNSNICDIRFITNIHIWFCGRNRLYRKPNWFNWNSINKSISVMSLLLDVETGYMHFHWKQQKSANCILNLLFTTVFTEKKLTATIELGIKMQLFLFQQLLIDGNHRHMLFLVL